MVWASRAHAGQQATRATASWQRVIDQGDDQTSQQSHPEKNPSRNVTLMEKQGEITAVSRSEWKHAIRKRAEVYENARQSSQQVKYAALEARTITAERSTEYPVCSHLCDFGLRSHTGHTNKGTASMPKARFEIFYNLLTALRIASNTYAQVALALSCANHVQHIERLSRTTCRFACHVVRRDSSAIKFDRA